MSRRNCWTCQNDYVEEASGEHICEVFWRNPVNVWIEKHVAPDSRGVPASMPPRDAPPCPGWVAARGAGAEAAATVNDSLTVAGGGQ
jgi:hypothetical protein